MIAAFDLDGIDREMIPRSGLRGVMGDPALYAASSVPADPATIVKPPPRSIIDECAEIAVNAVLYNPKDFQRMLAQVKAWTAAWGMCTSGECAYGTPAWPASSGDKADKVLSIASNTPGPIGWAAGAAGFIKGIFSKHHQNAVLKENTILCQLATDANTVLSQVDNAYKAGNATRDACVQSLDQLVSEYRSAIAPIAKRGNASQWKLAQVISLVEHRKRFEYRTEQPLGSPANPLPTSPVPAGAGAVPLAAPAPRPTGKQVLAIAAIGAVALLGVFALG